MAWAFLAAWSSNTTLSSAGYNIFLAKYDSAGNFRGVRQVGGPASGFATGIAVDPAGHVYVAGDFGDYGFPPEALSFGSSTIQTKGSVDAFIAKLNLP